MPHKPLLIRMFLREGIPNGVRSAEIVMSTIEAIAFPRTLLNQVQKELTLRTGVYLLAGENVNQPGQMIGYIGETEKLSARLQQHDNDSSKEFWTDTVVFMSKDANLTKAHIRYIEAELIKIAGKNPAWDQPNQQIPSSAGKLPKPDEVTMDEFVRQARTLTGTFGFSIFKVIENDTAQEQAAVAAQPVSPPFTLKADSYNASGVHDLHTGEFIVKAGSIARKEVVASMPEGSKHRRAELLANGVLVETENGLEFTQDYAFTSPSGAAGLISGSSMNGRTNWKTANGSSYGDYLTSLNNAS